MRLATAMACSGPVDQHGVARSASVASISARRGGRDQRRRTASARRRRPAPPGPGDQPGQAVGAVLGLHDHVDGGELDRRRVVGHDHDLGRAGERRRHADDAGHLPLGHGHVDVARPDDDVDRPDGLGAVGHGGDRLGAADAVDLVDAGQGRQPPGSRRATCPLARSGGTHSTIWPTPATRAGPRSSAPSTDSGPDRRARTGRPGRRAGAAPHDDAVALVACRRRAAGCGGRPR